MVKKKTDLMKDAKETMGIGIVGMAGMGAMGAMSSLPGMPSQANNLVKTTGVGLNLVGIGKVAQIGMGIGRMMQDEVPKNKKQYKWGKK